MIDPASGPFLFDAGADFEALRRAIERAAERGAGPLMTVSVRLVAK